MSSQNEVGICGRKSQLPASSEENTSQLCLLVRKTSAVLLEWANYCCFMCDCDVVYVAHFSFLSLCSPLSSPVRHYSRHFWEEQQSLHVEESHHHSAQHHCGKAMDRPGERVILWVCTIWQMKYMPKDSSSTLKMSSQPVLFCLLPVRGNRCGESHYWRPLPPEICTLQLLLQRCGQEGEEPSFFFTVFSAPQGTPDY